MCRNLLRSSGRIDRHGCPTSRRPSVPWHRTAARTGAQTANEVRRLAVSSHRNANNGIRRPLAAKRRLELSATRVRRRGPNGRLQRRSGRGRLRQRRGPSGRLQRRSGLKRLRHHRPDPSGRLQRRKDRGRQLRPASRKISNTHLNAKMQSRRGARGRGRTHLRLCVFASLR